MPIKISIINGPNLNLLGTRETEIYGKVSFEVCFEELVKRFPQVHLEYFQTNHEGAIIDQLQKHGFDYDGIILNAAGYSHTSIAIMDAVKAITTPVVEVHISDVYQREKFRHHSYLTDVVAKSIVGMGMEGYSKALDFFLAND